jgi:hypothetical protein
MSDPSAFTPLHQLRLVEIVAVLPATNVESATSTALFFTARGATCCKQDQSLGGRDPHGVSHALHLSKSTVLPRGQCAANSTRALRLSSAERALLPLPLLLHSTTSASRHETVCRLPHLADWPLRRAISRCEMPRCEPNCPRISLSTASIVSQRARKRLKPSIRSGKRPMMSCTRQTCNPQPVGLLQARQSDGTATPWQ